MKPFLRQFKKALSRIAIPVCLLVSIVVLIGWVRSFLFSESYRGQDLALFGNQTAWRLRTGEGNIVVSMQVVYSSGNPQATGRLPQLMNSFNRFGPRGYSRLRPELGLPLHQPIPDSILGSLGFQWRTYDDSRMGLTYTAYIFGMPFWFIFFVAVGYPLWTYISRVVQRQREERIAMGLCPTCGTPMRENVNHCSGCDRPMAVLQQI